MDLTVRVLTTGYWPGAANSNCVCNIPIPPRLSFEHFKGYFTLLYFTPLAASTLLSALFCTQLASEYTYIRVLVQYSGQSRQVFEYLRTVLIFIILYTEEFLEA